MEFHGKKIIENSPLAIYKPPPIPEISRLSLPVNLLLYRRRLAHHSAPAPVMRSRA